MKIRTTVGAKSYTADLTRPIDISIPLVFNGPQPNTYDVPPASTRPYQDGTFIGDTRQGGSCNFEVYSLVPHCNATHTECVGHISLERISVNARHLPGLIPATVISVLPVKAGATNEHYVPPKEETDTLLTAAALEKSLTAANPDFLKALVIRTLPNEQSKKSRRYLKTPPPFFSVEAITYLSSLQIEHLLVDMPSLDRAFDDGRLTAHHVFWGVPEGSQEVDPASHSSRTITEMIFVDDSVADGQYLLGIGLPNFVADAAPSRPLLYELNPVPNA